MGITLYTVRGFCRDCGIKRRIRLNPAVLEYWQLGRCNLCHKDTHVIDESNWLPVTRVRVAILLGLRRKRKHGIHKQ